MKPPFTIGKLAREAGVNVETVRYYQRVGLLDEPEKPVRGYRRYSGGMLDRILFIRRAKQLGFSLEEIGELLELGEDHCGDVRIRAERKRLRIREQIADLRAMSSTLDDLISACKAGQDDTHCPIIETLVRRDQNR